MSFKSFAQEHNHELLFVHASISMGLGKKLVDFIGINPERQDQIVIVDFAYGAMKKYIY